MTQQKKKLKDSQSIPSFSVVQSFQMMLSFLIIFIIGSVVVEIVPEILIIPVLLLMAVGMGFSVSFIQYRKKEESKKSFWLVGALVSVFAFIMISFYYYTSIII